MEPAIVTNKDKDLQFWISKLLTINWIKNICLVFGANQVCIKCEVKCFIFYKNRWASLQSKNFKNSFSHMILTVKLVTFKGTWIFSTKWQNKQAQGRVSKIVTPNSTWLTESWHSFMCGSLVKYFFDIPTNFNSLDDIEIVFSKDVRYHMNPFEGS